MYDQGVLLQRLVGKQWAFLILLLAVRLIPKHRNYPRVRMPERRLHFLRLWIGTTIIYSTPTLAWTQLQALLETDHIRMYDYIIAAAHLHLYQQVFKECGYAAAALPTARMRSVCSCPCSCFLQYKLWLTYIMLQYEIAKKSIFFNILTKRAHLSCSTEAQHGHHIDKTSSLQYLHFCFGCFTKPVWHGDLE